MTPEDLQILLDNFKSLTPREEEVLKLMCEGFNADEIANRLIISSKTVKSHRINIFHKLGLSQNKNNPCGQANTKAVIMALKSGFIQLNKYQEETVSKNIHLEFNLKFRGGLFKNKVQAEKFQQEIQEKLTDLIISYNLLSGNQNITDIKMEETDYDSDGNIRQSN